MTDVSAIVLTIGENTTQRTISSLKQQTLPPKDIILISNIQPFYKAFNLAASKVQTEFFIQADSDMVLDPDCIETLRKHMVDGVGIVVACVRDNLMGDAVGVNLFRRQCFDSVQLKDRISPDTDYENDIAKIGWRTVYLKSSSAHGKSYPITLGEHWPEYTPLYTYSSFLLRGRRCVYTKSLGGIFWHLRVLRGSGMDVSLFARASFSHGIFSKGRRDLLVPYQKTEDFTFLDNFLRNKEINTKIWNSLIFIFGPEITFKRYYKLGISLRNQGAVGASKFKHYMVVLRRGYHDASCIAEIGLCQGLFLEGYNKKKFKKDLSLLKKLFYVHLCKEKKFKRLRSAVPFILQFYFLFYWNMVKIKIKGGPGKRLKHGFRKRKI